MGAIFSELLQQKNILTFLGKKAEKTNNKNGEIFFI